MAAVVRRHDGQAAVHRFHDVQRQALAQARCHRDIRRAQARADIAAPERKYNRIRHAHLLCQTLVGTIGMVRTNEHQIRVGTRFFDFLKRFKEHLLVLVADQLRDVDQHERVLRDAPFAAKPFPRRCGVFHLKAREIHADAVHPDHRKPLGEQASCPSLVLVVEGDQQIGDMGKQPFDREEQQPVHQRRAGEEVKAVRKIDDLRALPARAQRGEASHQRAHRRMAIHDVVMLLIKQTPQLAHAAQRVQRKRRALPHAADLMIAAGHVLLAGGRHIHRPTARLQCLDRGHVKLEHVLLDHVGHQQQFLRLSSFLHRHAPALPHAL